MGLFNKITIKNQRKRRDKQIEEAQKLMERGAFLDANVYQKVYEILDDIINENDIIFSDHPEIYDEYRMDEVKKMYDECIAVMDKQQKQIEQNKQAEKNVIIEEHTDEYIDEYKDSKTDAECFAEAKRRINDLVEKVGLDTSVLAYWQEDSFQLTYCDLDENYVGKAVNMYLNQGESSMNYVYKAGDVDWMYEVIDFEENQESMVYHVIQQGEGLYLLFVSSNHLYWGEERLTQNDGSIFTNVTSGGYNISAYFCSSYPDVENDFVDIELFNNNGILTAKRALENIDEDEYEDNAEECADNNTTLGVEELEDEYKNSEDCEKEAVECEETKEESVEDGDDESIISYLEEEEYPDEFYAEAASNKEVISESLKKDMYTEAKRRLNLFCSKKELTGIVLHYWDCDRVCCSLPAKSAGYIPPADSNPAHIKAIEYIEQQFGCMVYHLVEEDDMLYALYVTPDKNCWQQERWNNGTMLVICCSAENPSDAHMTTAAVTSIHMVLTCKKTAYV